MAAPLTDDEKTEIINAIYDAECVGHLAGFYVIAVIEEILAARP
jgi:hypothetical protein